MTRRAISVKVDPTLAISGVASRPLADGPEIQGFRTALMVHENLDCLLPGASTIPQASVHGLKPARQRSQAAAHVQYPPESSL